MPGRHRREAELVRDGSHHAPGHQQHKLRYSFDNTRSTTSAATTAPRARSIRRKQSWRLPLYPAWLGAGAMDTAPITNRLLLEARLCVPARRLPRELPARESLTDAVAKWDLARGLIEENNYLSYSNTERKQEAKVAASYVTGSHSIKAGFENRWANALQANPYNGDISTLFTLNNVPLHRPRDQRPVA